MEKTWLLLGEISIEMLEVSFCFTGDAGIFDCLVANDFLKVIPRSDNEEAKKTRSNRVQRASINTSHTEGTF
jgi:hypothetical protein